ncbi:MAG: DUF748 domain-containing protein [Steroidobacteraceae bacterium]
MKRLLLTAAIVAVLVGLYALAGFLAVPHVLRSELVSYIDTHYHRRLALGDIRFNPFTLTLDVRNLSLPDADGTPMVGAGLLHVELSIASVWRRAASFRDILIERPFAHVVVRPDGALNLAALETPAAPPPPGPAPAVVRLVVDRFTVDQGRATYDDRTAAKPFHTELTPIDFELRDFSTIAAAADAYSLDITTTLGEHFQWSGNIGVSPDASRGRFEVTALRAATLASFLGNALPPLEISSGLIGIQGDYVLSVGSTTDLRVGLSRLTVSSLGIGPRKGASDDIDLSNIEVDGSTFDLAQHALDIGPVRLNGGTIRVWRTPAGILNVAELMAHAPASQAATVGSTPTAPAPASSTSTAAAPPPPAAVTWSLAAPDVSITGLEVDAEDRAVTPAVSVKLGHIALHVGGFRSPGDATLNVSASATVDRGGRLTAKGTYALESGAAQLRLDVSHLDLTALEPYLAQHSAVRLTSGLLGTKLEIARAMDGALTVTGDIGVAKLRTIDDRLRRDFVKWDRLTIDGLDYRSEPARLSIRAIIARAPYARVIVASDRKLNIAEAFTPRTAEATSHEPAEGAAVTADSRAGARDRASSHAPSRASSAAGKGSAFPFPVSIGKIVITKGSAHYTDLWIEPHFALAIQSLTGSISGMSSNPRSRAKVELDGKVDEYAPLHLSGVVNLLAATAYTDMTLSFKGVELTTATPYSAHFAGYKIEKGKISADIKYHIENGKLTANHHIVIDQLQLGEKVESKDAIKLPLKLAVALLKDRNGVIDLGLPVTGSLDDPKFKLGPLIWKVVVNVLAKAAAAPFKLLGRLFGGGEQMKYIDFEPGSADLDPEARDRLAKVGKALSERPSLELDVPSAYAPSLDRAALGRAMLDQKLVALSSEQAYSGKRARSEKQARSNKQARSAKQSGSGKQRQGVVQAGSAANPLADPAEHFRLLLAEYRLVLGKGAALPAEAEAAAAPKKPKKGEAPPALEPAIGALEAALLARQQVPNDRLDSLGRHRARAIRDALLGADKIAPGRLYVLNTAPTGVDGSRVRLELGLK